MMVPAWVVLLAGGLIAALLAWTLSDSALETRAHKRLLRDMALANGLTGVETRLLWRLAVHADAADPTLVFVRPSMFDAGAAAVARTDPALVRLIRGKLFGP